MPLLAPGEQVLLSEETASGSGRDGILTLTNYRIIFEGKRSQGLVHAMVRGAQYVAILDLQLAQLSNVHEDKPLIGRAKLRVDALGSSYSFQVRDAGHWSGAIRQAHQAAPRAHWGQGYQQPVVVNVSQSYAPPPPPPPPPPQTFLHCRHCGSLIPTGSPGGAMRCASCGAAL